MTMNRLFSVNMRDLDSGPTLAQQTLSASMSSPQHLEQSYEEKKIILEEKFS